jgi:hypothetical protein
VYGWNLENSKNFECNSSNGGSADDVVTDPNLDCFAKYFNEFRFEKSMDPKCKTDEHNSDDCGHKKWEIMVPSGSYKVVIELYDNKSDFYNQEVERKAYRIKEVVKLTITFLKKGRGSDR